MRVTYPKAFCLVSLVVCLAAAACSRDAAVASRESTTAGDRFVEKGKYSEAIIEYRKALQYDSRLGETRLKLGHAYLALNDYANAYREVMRAADVMPDNVVAQKEAGEMALRAGQFDVARQRALRMIKLQPKSVEGQILLGNALAGLDDMAGAISQVEQAIDADPTRTLSYANLGRLEYSAGNAAAAEAAFKRAVTVSPKAVDAHVALANFYWATGKMGNAEAELKTAAALDPSSAIAQLAQAAFYLNARRYAEAENSLKAYVKLTDDVGAKLTLVDLYLTLNKVSDAKPLLDQIVARPDGFIPATLRTASIEYGAGRPEEAHKLIAEALRRDPKNEDAHLVSARILLREKKFAAALTDAKAAVAANPRSVAGVFLQGLAAERLGSNDEALAAYQEALRLNPKALPAQIALARVNLALANYPAAAGFATEAAKAQPQLAAPHLLAAKAFANQGRLDAAMAELRPLEKTAPSVDLFVTLGRLYLAKRDFVLARQSFARAAAIDANSLEVLSGLVSADLNEKKGSDATARLNRRLAATPNDPNAHLLAAMTFAALDNRPAAEASFKRVIELDPANLDAYGGLARVYIADRRLDEARREFEQVAKRQPKPVAAKTMIGMIQELQNKPAEARTTYEQVLALDAEAPIASNNLAVAYAEKGENLDVALRLAQAAKAKMPNRHEVDDTLGWVYYKKGLYSLAIGPLQQSAAAAPNNPMYAFHLGLAYAQNGDKDKARQTLRRALELKGDFQGADEARRVLKTLAG
jgi:tetratricopeptide (TPR) repeat protein